MTDQQVIDACTDWWWHQPRFDAPSRDVIRDKWRAMLERDLWNDGYRNHDAIKSMVSYRWYCAKQDNLLFERDIP